eukprot:812260-Pleurochrysis_carterae.AAC.2
MHACCSGCRMLRASIVGLLALLSASSAQDFQCASQGNFLGSALTVSAASDMSVEEWTEKPCQANHVVRPRAISCAEGVDLDFTKSFVTCNNLGGLGPDNCPDKNIRYTNIGTDFGDGTTEPVVVDLVVTNLTLYKANNADGNGRADIVTGQLGQVNLADDFIADFKYDFFLTGTEIPVALSNPFNLLFLDLDYSNQQALTESVIVRGGTSIATIEDACRDQNQPSPCLNTTVIVEQLGPTTFKATANVRGVGSDNVYDLNQILQPVVNMTQEEKVAAGRYINITFPIGTSGFNVTYGLTGKPPSPTCRSPFLCTCLQSAISHNLHICFDQSGLFPP